jgi:hypothetical protein
MTRSLLKHDQGLENALPIYTSHSCAILLWYTPFRVLVYTPFRVLVYLPFVFYVLHLPCCHILTFLTVRPRSFPVPQLGSHSDLAN